MSTVVTFNSQQYTVPAYNDTGYAQGNGNLSLYLVAVASGTLQQSGGLFQLTAETDFGPNYGIKSLYFKSHTSSISSAGVIRLARADTIGWRNQNNDGDLLLSVDSSNRLLYDGSVIVDAGGIFYASNGSGALPSYTFITAPTNGMLLHSSTSIGWAADGVERMALLTTGLFPVADNAYALGGSGNRWSSINGTVILSSDGSVLAAGHGFISEPGLGWYRPGSHRLAAAVNGNDVFEIQAANTQVGTKLSIAYSAPADDAFVQITNSDPAFSGASAFSAVNNTGAVDLAAFGGAYVGSRIGNSAAGAAVLESVGCTRMLIGTNDAAPIYIGANAAAALSISTSNIISIVNAPIFSALTASTVPYLNASRALTSSAVTPTQLGFVDATSSIQTQIDSKSPTAGSSSIVTVGTISSGTWGATTIAVNKGGTGQTSYTDGQLLIGNSSGNTLGKATLTGTANQIVVTNGASSITLTTPQDIGTGSSPTFAALTVTTTSNQLVLGTTRTVTITAPTPATSSRVVTIPDLVGDYSVVGTIGTQTIAGAKTFSSAVSISATSNHLVLSTATNTLTINASTQATARVWSIPDISSAGTFAALEGTQTFSGAKTFSAALTLSNGLVGAPSVNVGDASTGLYRTASNKFAATLSGVKAVEFLTAGVTNATSYNPLTAYSGAGAAVAHEVLTQSTTGVSTSAVTILNMDVNGYICHLYGSDGSGNDFHDIINVSYYNSGTVGVISSATSRGSPAARTYTHGGDSVLQLTMGSGTYAIRATGFGIGA